MDTIDENKDMMKCIKCDNEMYRAKLVDGMLRDIILSNKKKGFLSAEHRCGILCYVCSHCGYIDLYADDPKGLKID